MTPWNIITSNKTRSKLTFYSKLLLMADVKRMSMADLVPDNKNANKGTQEGARLLEKSLRDLGAGRSVLLDKNNRVIAGNKTIEKAGKLGYGIVVVETTGNDIVAVKRIDIDLDSRKGRELAIADNKVSEENLLWDTDILSEIVSNWDIDLSALGFNDNNFSLQLPETDDMQDRGGSMEMETERDSNEKEYSENLFPLAIALSKAQKIAWDNWKKEQKIKGDTEAFLLMFKQMQQI